jgi:pyridoxamine 5'-phosphate oxidase
MSKYHDIRRSYDKGGLHEEDLMGHPLMEFKAWFDLAIEKDVAEANALVLSTVNEKGAPSSRVVLIKDVEERGITFYTSYNSKKAQEMAANPNVALNIYWPELERQVRIEGVVEKVSESSSDEYFSTRPLMSQLGAHISKQSEILGNREDLELELEKLTADNPTNVERPADWGGYIVVPNYIEFWQGRPSRLHDRIAFELKGETWDKVRLYP